MEKDYKSIRVGLEAFLPSVGKQVLDLRSQAKSHPEFARLKKDGSVITAADELSEDLIRAWIEERFSKDTIRGEERGVKQGGNQTWMIDPIDGTYNFSHFGNKFGISVGLAENNAPKLGVIFYPAEKVCISASEGNGAWINGEVLKISKGKDQLSKANIIGQAPLRADDPRFKEAANQQKDLLAKTKNEDLDWSYTNSFLKFLRDDKIDAILHFGATPYDIAGAVAIACELKLQISGYDGRQIDFSKDIIPIIISKNPKLHKAIVKTLNK